MSARHKNIHEEHTVTQRPVGPTEPKMRQTEARCLRGNLKLSRASHPPEKDISLEKVLLEREVMDLFILWLAPLEGTASCTALTIGRKDFT